MAHSVLITDGSAGFGPYAINFTLGYLNRNYVTVRVNEEVDGLGEPVYRNFIWLTDGMIQISNGSQPTAADTVTITRTIPVDILIHDYEDGAVIKDENLDESNLQLIMLVHQFLDGRIPGGMQNDFNMNGFRITNLGDGVSDTDAATMRQLNIILADPGYIIVRDDLLGPNTIGITAGSIGSVNTVATNIGRVNTVATNIVNVNTVANNMANVLSVDANKANINAAVANETAINTVANNINSVNTVAGNITSVNTVSQNIAEVVLVSPHTAEIVDVSQNIADVLDVSANIPSVVTVSGNINSVNTVAGNISSVVNVNNNMASVIAAPGAASSAASSRDRAYEWANNPEDVPVDGGEFSAYHWAKKSEESASGEASNTAYDNTDSGLAAENVQDAIDEVVDEIDNLGSAAEADVEDFATAAQGARADISIPADVYSWANPYLVQSTRKALTIKESTIIRLVVDGDERWRRQAADEVLNVESLLDTGSALTAGKDYYLYLCDDGAGGTEFVVSLNSTLPSGYTANNSRKIGGFHTLCVNAGTISGHPLSGYLAGEILPASVWCLNHRPHSNPEGMVYDEKTDIWVDIYLPSGTGENTKSMFGATVSASRPFTLFTEDGMKVKKSFLLDHEFVSVTEGSWQSTAISGGWPNPRTAGGHVSSAGHRMISSIGLEEGLGYFWQSIATAVSNTSLAGGDASHASSSFWTRDYTVGRGTGGAHMSTRFMSKPHGQSL